MSFPIRNFLEKLKINDFRILKLAMSCTDIEVEAEDLAHARELALEHAMNDSDKCYWKWCGDRDLKYQIEESQEI